MPVALHHRIRVAAKRLRADRSRDELLEQRPCLLFLYELGPKVRRRILEGASELLDLVTHSWMAVSSVPFTFAQRSARFQEPAERNDHRAPDTPHQQATAESREKRDDLEDGPER